MSVFKKSKDPVIVEVSIGAEKEEEEDEEEDDDDEEEEDAEDEEKREEEDDEEERGEGKCDVKFEVGVVFCG